ncbi:hypothetical protein ALPO108162_05455 [Alicyclobacillus pomorum]|jgi:hypothetical protein
MRNVYSGPHNDPHDDMSGGFCNHCFMKIKQNLYEIYAYFLFPEGTVVSAPPW